MCLARNWKQLSSFALTFIVGVAAGLATQAPPPFQLGIENFDKVVVAGEDRSFWVCPGDSGSTATPPRPVWEPRAEGLKILSKPKAAYTDAARMTLTRGKVVLRVTFLASGEIGDVVTVTELPHGLTEQAIAAARGIRFEPARRNGQAVTVTKTVEYDFTIF